MAATVEACRRFWARSTSTWTWRSIGAHPTRLPRRPAFAVRLSRRTRRLGRAEPADPAVVAGGRGRRRRRPHHAGPAHLVGQNVHRVGGSARPADRGSRRPAASAEVAPHAALGIATRPGSGRHRGGEIGRRAGRPVGAAGPASWRCCTPPVSGSVSCAGSTSTTWTPDHRVVRVLGKGEQAAHRAVRGAGGRRTGRLAGRRASRTGCRGLRACAAAGRAGASTGRTPGPHGRAPDHRRG